LLVTPAAWWAFWPGRNADPVPKPGPGGGSGGGGSGQNGGSGNGGGGGGADTTKDKITNAIGMKLALIPAGTFEMGLWREGEPAQKHYPDEGPRHQVKIPQQFYMGVYEVTQGEYEKVMGMNPSAFSADGDQKMQVKGKDTSRFPVESVTWEEAREFCRKLSERSEEQKAGRVYHLPTEAEWEYACRAGAEPFHFGKSLSFREANFDTTLPFGGGEPERDSLRRPRKVGSYKPNAFGLYDMHGNVAEWCSDYYQEDYYRTGGGGDPVVDPQGPAKGDAEGSRVFRGGSWAHVGRDCRATSRQRDDPKKQYWTIGFRVVCVVGASKK
jgi:formylglycine-generating enzyme required for sulfatase activity